MHFFFFWKIVKLNKMEYVNDSYIFNIGSKQTVNLLDNFN